MSVEARRWYSWLRIGQRSLTPVLMSGLEVDVTLTVPVVSGIRGMLILRREVQDMLELHRSDYTFIS